MSTFSKRALLAVLFLAGGLFTALMGSKGVAACLFSASLAWVAYTGYDLMKQYK